VDNIVYTKCKFSVGMIESSFDYLGFYLIEKVLCCPKCRFVYITEELGKVKITQLETALEENKGNRDNLGKDNSFYGTKEINVHN
jgi:hypothetical protein